MARFLSPAWVAQLDDAAVAAAEGLPPAEVDDLEVSHVVEGAPGGEVAFRFCLVGGRLRVRHGQADHPTVTLRQDHATAAAIARGELSAQSAFMAGRLRIGGDLRALVAAQAALAPYDDAFAPVRATTTY